MLGVQREDGRLVGCAILSGVFMSGETKTVDLFMYIALSSRITGTLDKNEKLSFLKKKMRLFKLNIIKCYLYKLLLALLHLVLCAALLLPT